MQKEKRTGQKAINSYVKVRVNLSEKLISLRQVWFMTVSASTLSEIDSALKEYSKLVLASDFSAASQAIYIDHANNFVRWLKGELFLGPVLIPFL